MKEVLVRATRADVAKEAEVTETIVSYVINDNRYVDSEKRRRVQEAVKKLGYRPNTMARALKGKKTNHILFVVDDILSEHFGAIISEMNQLAYSKGYFISLCSDNNDEQFVQRIYDHFFDGVVIGSARFLHSNMQKLINTGIPVVLLAIREYEDFTGVFGKINTGLYDGARQCVKALYEKGRRNILYVDSLASSSVGVGIDTSDFRYRGYIDQMTEYKLPCGAEQIISGHKTEEELIARIKECMGARLGTAIRPDGIFGRTDTIACASMEGVQQAGFSIPHDVSVIGFNNSGICKYSSPKLTSIKIDRKAVGQKVLEFLETLIDKKTEKSLEAILKTEVIMRESV